jgi:hypothetical protein
VQAVGILKVIGFLQLRVGRSRTREGYRPPDGRANQNESRTARRPGNRALHQLVERSEQSALPPGAAPFDQGCRRARILSRRCKPVSQERQRGYPHVDRERPATLNSGLEIDLDPAIGSITCDKGDAPRGAAMGQRDASLGGAGKSRGDPGHDLE